MYIIAIPSTLGGGHGNAARLQVDEHRGFKNGAVPPDAAAWAESLQNAFDGSSDTLALTDGVLNWYGDGSDAWIEHNPWCDDASHREDEVYALFTGQPYNRSVASRIAERFLVRDFPWVRTNFQNVDGM